MISINDIDITDAVTEASVSQQLNAGASIMNFSVMKAEAGKIFNGDTAAISYNGKALFVGRVFSRAISGDKAEISAMDSLRALKAVFPVMRAEQPAGDFIKILAALAAPELKIGHIENIAAVISEKRFERQPLIELIYRTLEEAEGRYVLRDEAGVVCLKNEADLKTDLVLDGANVLEIKYQSTVGQSCNYIKLTSNSVENALSVSAVVSDNDSIAKYGRCCYIAELDEKNPEQLMLKAKNLLEQNSGEKQKLWLTAVGDTRAQAGNMVFVDIASVGSFWARITSAEHVFEGKTYTVMLQLEQL